MEQTNLGYSLKNIPYSTETQYMKAMLDKLSSFIRRLRWKAFFLEKSTDEEKQDKANLNKYGFKSDRCPPQHDGLIGFENALYKMVRAIKFRRNNNQFQCQLARDSKAIKNSTKLLVEADKTTNLYKLDVSTYNNLLNDNVTASYRIDNNNTVSELNKEAKNIVTELKLEDKVERMSEQPAFITLKDHKENFHNNPKCRLINPAKSEIGKISKFHLDKINNELRNYTKFNQWRNTTAVISWFKAIENKAMCRFIKYDIVNFYPSITKELLDKALCFARNITPIEEKAVKSIMICRKCPLFFNSKTWEKSNGTSFDVTMGSFDGAEVCELVGLYLLSQLSSILGKSNNGLYRDDGLAILKNVSGPKTDSIRKKIIKLFQKNGLKITIETGLTQTDFLDATFNLKCGKYWPYRKPNDHPLYINTRSNHPPTIKKQIPTMISQRLSQLSSSKKEFDKAAPVYNEALKRSGYNCQLEFQETSEAKRNKGRKRNIVWFNPPYCESVTTNVGKEFLKLLSKHFPPQHKLYKICNRNKVKVSYSCMPNMAAIIASHNKGLLRGNQEVSTRDCNCRSSNTCPLNGKCRSKCLVYKAAVTSKSGTKDYYGCCETEFKARFYNHNQSFKYDNKRNATALSKEVWRAKDEGDNPIITWEIAKHAKPYYCGARRCDLCVTEQLHIIRANPVTSLNKKSEITGKCRHKNKFKLVNFKPPVILGR